MTINLIDVKPRDQILDVGCSVGGPMLAVASRFLEDRIYYAGLVSYVQRLLPIGTTLLLLVISFCIATHIIRL
ncbi:hypothetical protein JCGZ_19525 [Jatropha curcas]|uniref:Methyltransferase n=1 Tax=Jatropha curcas TaxID=180498 RepID=A0A067KAX4_JATCU|nr:hypothetical protein JCGZ_19525 [Jatropha curcas]